MVAIKPSYVELDCPVQNYDWGRLGPDSLVAKLSGQKIKVDQPYAELWMGTHPSAPAKIKNTEEPLSNICDLPFLFKVLSIRKALSIQAHPDKVLAQELHRQAPQVYRDPHHKPEVIIALTPFEALCGFRPLAEIQANLKAIPEFAALVKCPLSQLTDLKSFFAKLMLCPSNLVKEQLQKLKARCAANNPSELETLVLRLDSQFPDEVGSFCCLILNYAQLKPGQALFLAANEPHAYLSGEGVECMAPSDNVVRAGLTPKFRDVDTLIKMLTYRTYQLSELYLEPKQISKGISLYAPPVEEFCVFKIALESKQEATFPAHPQPTVMIVISGKGKAEISGENVELKAGKVVLVKQNQAYKLQAQEEPLLIFSARQP